MSTPWSSPALLPAGTPVTGVHVVHGDETSVESIAIRFGGQCVRIKVDGGALVVEIEDSLVLPEGPVSPESDAAEALAGATVKSWSVLRAAGAKTLGLQLEVDGSDFDSYQVVVREGGLVLRSLRDLSFEPREAPVQVRVRAGHRDQDRVRHFLVTNRHVFVVADGAGNSNAGGDAADAVLEIPASATASATSIATWIEMLDRSGRIRDGGQTTAVVVVVDPATRQVHGASVGDSSAWLIDRRLVELTSGQNRKPLVGSGRATAVRFSHRLAGRQIRLLVGTDGLFNYARRSAILAAMQVDSAVETADRLLEMPRLRSGRYPDDIGFVFAQVEPDSLPR